MTLALLAALSLTSAYDPLATPLAEPTVRNLTVHDAKRSRDIPIKLYMPKTSGAAPVVLFSHGLGGSREGGAYLALHWAKRGYVAVCLQHPGSDESVWKSAPLGQRMTAMRQAASGQNFMLRVKDVPAVLDQMAEWNRKGEFKGRIDLTRVGMSGHSFGAVTTEAVSGQSFPLGTDFTDSRIKAAIPMSPSTPKGSTPEKSFGNVSIPWLLMTGTEDDSPIGDQSPESRLLVFPALPKGEKYQVVLFGAEHAAFADERPGGARTKRNPNHHKVILALSSAFWDAYVKGDAEAKRWLDGNGPRSVLEKRDTWEKK